MSDRFQDIDRQLFIDGFNRRMQENMSKNRYRIPPPTRVNMNLDEQPGIRLEVTEFGVAEWTPARDGQGKPEAVSLHFTVAHPADPSRPPIIFDMRVKSPERMDQIIALLRQYQLMVWPDHAPGSGAELTDKPDGV